MRSHPGRPRLLSCRRVPGPRGPPLRQAVGRARRRRWSARAARPHACHTCARLCRSSTTLSNHDDAGSRITAGRRSAADDGLPGSDELIHVAPQNICDSVVHRGRDVCQRSNTLSRTSASGVAFDSVCGCRKIMRTSMPGRHAQRRLLIPSRDVGARFLLRLLSSHCHGARCRGLRCAHAASGSMPHAMEVAWRLHRAGSRLAKSTTSPWPQRQCGFIVGDTGVLAIDTGTSYRHAAPARRDRAHHHKPVRRVLITHTRQEL